MKSIFKFCSLYLEGLVFEKKAKFVSIRGSGPKAGYVLGLGGQGPAVSGREGNNGFDWHTEESCH